MATRSRVFGGEGFSVLVQVARGLMQGGAQINGIQGFAQVVPQLKRAVFPGEGKKIGLLRHQVNFKAARCWLYQKNP